MAPTFQKGDWVRRTREPERHRIGQVPFQVRASTAHGVLDPNGQYHDPQYLELFFAPIMPPIEVELPMGNTFRDWGNVDRPFGFNVGIETQPGETVTVEDGRFTVHDSAGHVTHVGRMADPVDDGVTHPSHYNRGGVEVVDIIDAYGLDFYTGSGIKYVLRSQYKENELKDLKKAVDVLQKKIALLEADE